MHFSTLLPLALLPAAFAQLNTLAKAKGFLYFGSATDNGELTDTTYLSILSDTSEFGQITPGNTQKWDTIEPTQNTFSYTKGDVISALAVKNGQKLRCHTLLWHNQLPSWVTSGTWTNATLTAALQNHITNVVTHYKGQCYAWDVVNEAFNEDGTYRTSIFYNTIGPEYIAIAFRAAAAADPSVKLYYNDYNIESAGGKSTAALNLVKSLQARGIKIDGVGLQAHFIVGSTPSRSAQVTNMKTFTALGVEVAVTELDVRFSSLPPTTAGLTQQGIDYVSTIGACLDVGASCVGVTVWDFTDKYSWVPSTFSGQGQACLWYADFTKHPAYAALVSLLGGTPTTTSIASSTTSGTSVTTTAASGTVARWGQCGGLNYTGSTTCVAGTTCTYSNDWYSQCL
jgi:endo-1,4-beta-xylanase